MEYVLTPLAKSNLVPLGSTPATSAKDADIPKQTFGICTTT